LLDEFILIEVHDDVTLIDQSSDIFTDESPLDISISAKAQDKLVTQSNIDIAIKLLFAIFIRKKLIYKCN
jgi:hypothetical protein